MLPVVLGAIGAGLTGLYKMYMTWRNYKQQEEAYEWQKSAQETTWNREDTAVQRSVEDLRAAGLSPTLAAGHGAPTSQPIRPTAPQMQDPELDFLAKIQQAYNIQQTQASTAKTNAELQYIELQKAKANREIKGIDLLNAEREWNMLYYINEGQPTNVGGMAKAIMNLRTLFWKELEEMPNRPKFKPPKEEDSQMYIPPITERIMQHLFPMYYNPNDAKYLQDKRYEREAPGVGSEWQDKDYLNSVLERYND